MAYLSPAEYVQYGLTADTTDDWIAMASALIDAHCRRPSLFVTQYVERMRLTAGSQSVRLSYLPLAPLGSAASPLVAVRVRYGRPRRGELQDPMLAQVAWAFSLPGSWSTLRPQPGRPQHCNRRCYISQQRPRPELQRSRDHLHRRLHLRPRAPSRSHARRSSRTRRPLPQ